jgi:hypothetical protein
MKIRFRIGAEQGRQQTRTECPLSADTKTCRQDRPVTPPSPWSPGWPGSSGTPPIENPVDHSFRRGAACCARCRASDQRRSLANSRSTPTVASWLQFQAQPTDQPTVPTTKNPLKTVQFSDKSNRFWPKNRSYRKQAIKPCLTGARTAFSDSGFCAVFPSAAVEEEAWFSETGNIPRFLTGTGPQTEVTENK